MTLQSLTRPGLASRWPGLACPSSVGHCSCGSLRRCRNSSIRWRCSMPTTRSSTSRTFRTSRRASSPSAVGGRQSSQVHDIVDGRAVFDPFPRAQALPMLEWVMNWCVFTRPHQFLLLHCRGRRMAGSGARAVGAARCGQEHAVAALVARGARLLSDEVAVIPPGTRGPAPAAAADRAQGRVDRHRARGLASGRDRAADAGDPQRHRRARSSPNRQRPSRPGACDAALDRLPDVRGRRRA